jgi:hypothetical protein
VVAANASVGGQPRLVIGAVLGQGGLQPLPDALAAGQRLIEAGQRLVTTFAPVRAGQVVATLAAPWANPVPLAAPAGPTLVAWNGLKGTVEVAATGTFGPTVAAGSKVATLTITLGAQKVVLPLTAEQAIPRPPLRWRLLRP